METVEKLLREVQKAKNDLDRSEFNADLNENGDEVGIVFLHKAEKLAKTKDKRGLMLLLDYFDEEFDIKYEGNLERLQNNIFDNYSYDEIIDAFYEKFDQLLNKNQWRAECISRNFFDSEEDFENFRKMFNTVKAKKSMKFLDGLEHWLDDSYDVGLEGVEILREDMKKW